MPIKTCRAKETIYNKPRYWYHISSTLLDSEIRLVPWDENKAINRSPVEPLGKRICVAPSVEQCLTAVPYYLGSYFTVYRTKYKVKADRPHNVFDSNVTQEGWIQTPITFVRLGTLDFGDVENGLKISHVIEEAASGNEPRQSGKVLKWWKKVKVKRFIKS